MRITDRRVFMKTSEMLYAGVIGLWNEATEKEFVKEMAMGTLEHERFRNYMLRDYLYLNDYIELIKIMTGQAQDPEIKAFLNEIFEGTESELRRVHLPNIARLGITGKDISAYDYEGDVLAEYAKFMRLRTEEKGLVFGMTALLQCSWAYAFIGETIMDKYADIIKGSPYKSWFDSYVCNEYTEVNKKWIEMVDRVTQDANPELLSELRDVFCKCAEFENRFWDSL